ncbi:MAG: histidine kinase N-terminal 7TM domain-containing protein, partial [Anaerolineaceae bacterium]
MADIAIAVLSTLNQFLAAGIAITAVSMLLYALSFNLKDRVARSFIIIMVWMVLVFACDALGSVASSPAEMEFWFKLQWIGIVFLPPSYIQFADSLLATTGRPSKGKRTLLIRLTYIASLGFLISLIFSLLVGELVQDVAPAPHLQRTTLTWIFSIYYLVCMLLAGSIFIRAYQRTTMRASRRRMG